MKILPGYQSANRWLKPFAKNGNRGTPNGSCFSRARAGQTNDGQPRILAPWSDNLPLHGQTCASPFWGSGTDRKQGETINKVEPNRCLDLTGKLSLPEMVEWIRLGSVMVSNDTGPMHVAAALKKPLVAIFGPTEPRRTGPYGQLDSVIQTSLPCVPCMKPVCHYREPLACLHTIPISQITARVKEQLRRADEELQ